MRTSRSPFHSQRRRHYTGGRQGVALLELTDVGTLEAGKSADFGVLEANRLDDITNTRRIAEVYLRGTPGGAECGLDRPDVPVGAPTQELLCRMRGVGGLAVVPVELGASLRPDEAQVVFEGRYDFSTGFRQWDLSPDGQRFLMMKPVGAPTAETSVQRQIIIPTEGVGLNRWRPARASRKPAARRRRRI